MEFPHLGEHCNLKECNLLDFLPFKCVGCSLVFCKDHFEFEKHSCAKASQYDHQVPICPICDSPVSFKYGDLPDVNMNRHIDEECAAKRKNKVFKNKCSMSNCRDKEIIELICDGCKLNYCLKHRHAIDHNCSAKYLNQNIRAKQSVASGLAANAAMQRIVNNGLNKTSNFVQKMSNMISTSNNTPNRTDTYDQNQLRQHSNQNVAKIQGDLNEDEALSIAIQQSLNEQTATSTNLSSSHQGTHSSSPIVIEDNEEEDLRRAIEMSKREYEKNKEKCSLS